MDEAVQSVLPEGAVVVEVTPHGKTNWSDGYKVVVQTLEGDSKAYFMKVVDKEKGLEMVRGEYEGQLALRAVIPDNIPQPVAYGTYKENEAKHFYIAEFCDMRDKAPKPKDLAKLLAKLHTDSFSPTGKFGFPITTYKGFFRLQTDWCDSWEEFFTRQLRAEVEWEKSVRGKDDEMDQLIEQLFDTIIPRLLRPLQTGGRSIKPTLCHGDLWHGNCATNIDTQELMVFDSCVAYMHNEFELSLMRHPRYLLNKPHLDEYTKVVVQSEPVDDFDDRNALYSLRNDIVVSALWDSWTVRLRTHVMEEIRRLLEKFPGGINGFTANEAQGTEDVKSGVQFVEIFGFDVEVVKVVEIETMVEEVEVEAEVEVEVENELKHNHIIITRDIDVAKRNLEASDHKIGSEG